MALRTVIESDFEYSANAVWMPQAIIDGSFNAFSRTIHN